MTQDTIRTAAYNFIDTVRESTYGIGKLQNNYEVSMRTVEAEIYNQAEEMRETIDNIACPEEGAEAANYGRLNKILARIESLKAAHVILSGMIDGFEDCKEC
jgi:hypothetical protein